MKIPNFPPLTSSKTTRLVTKHYTNLAMYEERSQFSFLTWLIYQSDADNSVYIDQFTIKRYRHAVMLAMKEYKAPKRVNYSIDSVRGGFKELLSKGYLFPTNKPKVYLINPMLSYSPIYVGRDRYNEFQNRYQGIESPEQLSELIEWYQRLINVRSHKKL